MSTGWNRPNPLPDGSDLAQRLAQAEKEIRSLSDRLLQLQQKLDDMQAKPTYHVEYHFDQLKVNELKGTLNVGLSPQGVQGIDSFETPPGAGGWPGVSLAAPAQTPDPIGPLQQQMADYMDREAAVLLLSLEERHGVSLDGSLRQRVLQDVKKQLNERVHYYAKTAPYPAQGTDQERQKWKQSVIDKTTRDIETAFSAYLAGRKRQNEAGGSA